MKSLSSTEAGSQFSALKKDFLFHEKRMQLLLSSSIVEGFDAAIAEKLTTRNECAADCTATLAKLNHASQMPTLSGRWNEAVVASVLQLNIPLRDVIGSQLFEATPAIECEDLKEIILRLAEQSQEHAEFQSAAAVAAAATSSKSALVVAKSGGDANGSDSVSGGIGPDSDLVKQLIKSVEPTALSFRDVKRMKDAVHSKLRVIAELSHLSEALQKSGFQLAQARAEVCRLQEEEAIANDNGEVAVSETLVEGRIAALEKIIDIIFFRLHTVDATVDTNVTKRHSNLQSLQHSAVALEGVKREKQDAVSNCTDDIRRIDRSLQLQQVKERNDSKGAEMLAESRKRLQGIDTKRSELQDRLQQLGQEFIETERALAKLGVERAVAIDRHLDLVEQSRHLAADFAEMARFAAAHRSNLEVTRERCTEGLGSVALLERLLLQETDFMQYNFRASAQRLQLVRENVASELRAALREYEISIGEMLRRKQEIVLGLDEQIHLAECEAELRKDVFDPSAKKYVDKRKDLEQRRKKIVDEMCVLSEKLGQQLSTIKSRLGDEFIGTTTTTTLAIGGAGMHNANKGTSLSSSAGAVGGGGRFGAVSALRDDTARGSESKRLVSELKGKVLAEMAQLERESANSSVNNALLSSAPAVSSTTTTTRTPLQQQQSQRLRDVVDGVSRISEDDELLRRNLRKHEKLLDNRQALLEGRNATLLMVDEKRQLEALQQHVESSYIGPGPHHHIPQRQEFLSSARSSRGQRHRDALASQASVQRQQQQQRPSARYGKRNDTFGEDVERSNNDSQNLRSQQLERDALDSSSILLNDSSTLTMSPGASAAAAAVAAASASYGSLRPGSGAGSSAAAAVSRSQMVRDEIRRARSSASALFSPPQKLQQSQEQHGDQDNAAAAAVSQHSVGSTYRSSAKPTQQERGLAQILAPANLDDDYDDDEDAIRHQTRRPTLSGTATAASADAMNRVRVAAERRYPRVIGQL